MKILSYASILFLTYSALFTSTSLANNALTGSAGSNENRVPASTGTIFTVEMRAAIKREVMSQPGVLLDMANMTDNGYAWTNDVVWAGSSAAIVEADAWTEVGTVADNAVQWYIAGFLFERSQYKGVWLQYTFTLSASTGAITNFRRWYGNAKFR